MKKIVLVCSIVALLLVSCKSSYTRIGDKNANYIPYYLKVYEADSLYIIGEYKSSYEILDSLFKQYEPINMEVYNEYETYLSTAYLNKIKQRKIDKILKKSFLTYGSRYSFFEIDTLLTKIINKSKYNKNDLTLFTKKYVKNLNLPLRDEIEKIIEIDKECRMKNPIDFELLSTINIQNSEKLKVIFKKYGFPSNKKIGYYNFNEKDVDLGAVFKHCEISFLENYLFEKLKEYQKNGESSPGYFESVYDRFLISYKGGRQYYGSFYKNKNELMPLIDEKKLDSIRKSAGLTSVNYNIWRLKAKFGYEY